MSLLFVYGTLKRGDVRHSLLASQRFLGNAVTKEGYTLFDLGTYPGLVQSPAGRVRGELYEVNGRSLAAIDREEGVDEGLYRRAAVRLAEPHCDEAAETYLYLGETVGHRELDGEWVVAGGLNAGI